MILIIYQTPCLSSAAVNQASMGLALHFDDVGQLPDLVEHAAQIGDTGDLHREGHVGEVRLFVGPRLHGDLVDLVVSQHRGNVAQQPVAVDCDDAYVDGIGLLLAAPLDLDEALRALVLIAQHIAAIAAMDGVAAAAGDVADDALARHWFAAARELGHEIADAHDTDAAALAARRGRRCGQLGKLVGHGRVYLLHSVHGLRGLHVAAADGREQVVGFGEVEAARNVVEIHRTETEALHLLLEGRATGRDVGFDVLLFEPVLHLGTRTRGLQITEVRVEPVAARRALLDREQLHLLPRLQAVGEGYDVAVDLRAARAMTELGVDVIGEIERRGAVRQIDDVALGREHVYAVLEQIAVVAAVAAMGDVVLPLQQLAQQGDLAIEAGIGCHAFFVAPVRSHAELRVLMHLVRADLHLYRAALRTDHCRVYRTVAVVLWRGDVVVELAGDVLPEPVHDTARRVAVAHLVHQHAHLAHIVDLAVVDVLAAHLAPDAVDVFGATVDLGLDAVPRERVGERLHELIDVALAIDAARLQHARDLFINIRMQIAEGEILELPLNVPDTQAIRERRVDVECFLRDASLPVLRQSRQGAHIVRAIGELDEHHAHVIRNREQHLAQGLCLTLLFYSIAVQAVDHLHFGDAVDLLREHAGAAYHLEFFVRAIDLLRREPCLHVEVIFAACTRVFVGDTDHTSLRVRAR